MEKLQEGVGGCVIEKSVCQRRVSILGSTTAKKAQEKKLDVVEMRMFKYIYVWYYKYGQNKY